MTRKMKDSNISYVGLIPVSWKIVKLNKLIKRLSTGLNPRDNFSLGYGNNYYVTIKNLKNGKLLLDTNCASISKEAIEIIRSRSDLQIGDILFASISKEPNTYVIKEHPTNWDINESLFTIRPNKSLISTQFLNYILNSPYFYDSLLSDSTGSTFQSIKQDKLKSTKVILPTLEEQNKITSFLDKKIPHIDFLTNKAIETIEDYKKYKQSLITQTVTKGLNPNVKLLDSKIYNINKIPYHWNLIKFKYLATLNNGKEVFVEEGNVPVYGSGGIFKYTDKPLFTGTSLLLGRKGTIDKPMLVNGPFWTVDTMFYTSEIKEIVEKFLYYCACSIIDFDYYKSGSVLPSMTQTELNNIYIPFPPNEEQHEIVNYLDQKCSEIDNLISKKETLIKDLEAYKKSLIYEAVTGKIEI